jgi:DNA-binding protein HU-beta
MKKNAENYKFMTNERLIASVSELYDLPEDDVTRALDAIFQSIQKCLQAGKNVKLVGFGTFRVTKYSARIGRNPKTGEILKLPAKRFPRFKAGKTLKESLV